MPKTNVRGVNLNYRILGERGPWVTLSPGGRNGLENVLSLGQRLAEAGYRVLLHDRRNCGASDVAIDGDAAEYEIWADDLYALLAQLDALPVFAGGASSGCRLSLLLALRYPQAVRGLLLWRVTGGAFAAQRLAENYYGQYIDAAQRGGMAAVCETEFFQERIARNRANRERLLGMDPQHFIRVMTRWREYFLESADLPLIGTSAETLQSIGVPACIVPGHDRTHPRAAGELAARLIPNGELHILLPEEVDAELAIEDWDDKEEALAAIFIDFLGRVSAPAGRG